MQKKCTICGRYFSPNPRVGDRQKTCGRKKCRKLHKKEYAARWKAKNPEYFKGRYEETRDCPSRDPEARKQYLSQEHVRQKNTERMAQYRAEKKIAKGKSVVCTNCDIEVKPIQGQSYTGQGMIKIHVMRTKGDTRIILSQQSLGTTGGNRRV